MRYENLHNHTVYSDGYYSPDEIINHAIKLGMNGIGISDHYETRKVKSVYDLSTYFTALNKLKLYYKGRINVYVALEIDFSSRTDFGKLEKRKDFIIENCDYLLFEYVGNELWSDLETGYFFEVRHWFDSIPVGFAHTFIERDLLPKVDNLAQKLNKANVFIELCAGNRNLHQGLPNFISMKDFAVKNREILFFSAATDTHNDIEQMSYAADAYNFIKTNALQLFRPEIKYP